MKTLNTLDIKGLFGRYDFSINFRDKNGFVMLAAPNGYGKSTILRMIHAILCGNVFFFNELHFSEIHLTFASGNPGYRSGVDIIKRYKNDDYADEYVIHNEESLTDDSIDPYTAEREYEEYLASLNEEQRKKHEEELARIEEEEANQYPQKERIRRCNFLSVKSIIHEKRPV